MPKGVPIRDHLNNPDFKILYSALKNSNLKDTDFTQVALELGCKDAAFARSLLNRTMKAQDKRTTPKITMAGMISAAAPKTLAKARKNGTTDGSTKKKRKIGTATSKIKTIIEISDENDAGVEEEAGLKQQSETEAEDDE